MQAGKDAGGAVDETGGGITLSGLLLLFLKIGSIGFGGGMAILALMERELVRKHRLLAIEEFLHGAGFGQILGSVAVNVAVFAGCRLFGIVGGVLSAAVFLLPSVILVIGLSELYFRFHAIPALQGAVAGLAPVVIALIAEAGLSIGSRVVRTRAAYAVALAALAAGALQLNALWVLAGAGAAGYFATRGAEPPSVEPRAVSMIAFAPLFSSVPLLGTIAFTFLKVGLLFFGGGFLLLPVLHQRLVTDLHWLSAREFVDGVAISNLTPGPISILATFAGYHVGGIAGAVVATAMLMAPAAALMLVITHSYETFRADRRAPRLLAWINPAIAGLILSTAILLGRATLASWRSLVCAAVSLVLLGKLRWPPAIVLGLGAIAGYFGLLP